MITASLVSEEANPFEKLIARVSAQDLEVARQTLCTVPSRYPGMTTLDISKEPLPPFYQKMYVAAMRANRKNGGHKTLMGRFWAAVRTLHPSGHDKDCVVVLRGFYYACFNKTP